jgi:5-methylcytosine-specific restriction enzyme subunit McrC
MMAYAHVYDCPSLTFLYPHHDAPGIKEGVIAEHRIAKGANALNMAAVPVGSVSAVSPAIRQLLVNV